MSTVHDSIDVEVPVALAYERWTRFEDFPRFMEGVTRIERVDDETLRWHVTVAGVARSFLARIEERDQEQRIAWRAIEGERHTGAVDFEALDEERTRITLEMSYEPEDWKDKVADALDLIDRRVARDLEQFKQLVERESGGPTGPRTAALDDRPDDPAAEGAAPDTQGLPTHPGEGRHDPVQDPSRRL